MESTRLNAEANGVQLNAGLPDAAHGRYDIVLANILATPLKVLAPLLCEHVAPGGSLVLAGILERQADELKLAYAPYAALEVSDSEDGWILMTARPLLASCGCARRRGATLQSAPHEPGHPLPRLRHHFQGGAGPASHLRRMGALRPLQRGVRRDRRSA